jgi:hypothetical protein
LQPVRRLTGLQAGFDGLFAAAQVAKLLNCTPEDVAILVTAGKLRPPGRPNSNVVKFFSAVELMNLLADREWLDEAAIGLFWKRKNARRKGVPPTNKRTCPQFTKISRAPKWWL